MERQGKLLVFTSPTLQEGKTTTIVNVALTMAQNGQRTLLVGSNLRRPSIHRFFGIDREPGLSDILVGNASWRDCIRTVADIIMGRFEMEDIMASPGLDNLHIIESGAIPANPSELLSSPAMGRFLREVREEYDVVLIDTPPVLPVTDSAIVAAQVDGVILVYQAGKVGRLVLKRAKAHLESTRASVWGVVLNDVQSEIAGYTYAHYYTHYYGEETGPRPPGGRMERLWAFVRRRRTAPASPLPLAMASFGDDGQDVIGDEPDLVPPRRRRKYRNILGGLGIVLLLVAGLAGVAAWHLRWFARDERPKSLERQPPPAPAPRTESVTPPLVAPAPVAAPAVPAAPLPAAPAPVLAPRNGPVVTARDAPAREPAPREAPGKETPAVAQAPRFAVEFGPFLTGADAEKTERQLNQAGHQTVRFRQRTGAGLYAVIIERVPGVREANALVATLREQGFADAEVVGGGDAVAVRAGEPMLLRAAVQLAESLRAKGHQVRVAAQPGEAQTIVIRHGNFASREEAEAKGGELTRLGLPNHVVRAK
jgi:Mrp family chromosome partitioning ATPase/cell division septation protein DedD